MLEKLKLLVQNDTLFYGVLLILVAISSFGLGRQSILERGAKDTPEEQAASVILAPKPSVSAPTAPTPTPINKPAATSQATVPGTNITPAPSTPPSGLGTDGEVVASKSGSKYHLPTCPGAKQIKPENLITFSSRDAAEAAGYTPAANCKGLQ